MRPNQVTPRSTRGEQRHGRVVVLGIAALLLLSTSPVFAHHFAFRADEFLAGKDHVWFICLIAVHELLAPVHEIFHGLIISGVVYAAWDRTRAWWRARASLAVLDARTPSPGDVFWSAAHAAHIEPDRLRVAAALPVPAFTVGWFHPRIYVARELASRLATDELDAVVMHEAEHVRRRDPFQLSLFRLISFVLWWVPALRLLADDAADEAEIRADDAAARGRPLVLASAILSLAEWRGIVAAPLALGVGFVSGDLLERRVRRLAGEQTRAGTHLTRRSMLGAGAVLAAVWLSGLIMTHPMPASMSAMPNASHCAYHHEMAILHLFCPGFGLHSLVGHCPHPAPLPAPASAAL